MKFTIASTLALILTALQFLAIYHLSTQLLDLEQASHIALAVLITIMFPIVKISHSRTTTRQGR